MGWWSPVSINCSMSAQRIAFPTFLSLLLDQEKEYCTLFDANQAHNCHKLGHLHFHLHFLDPRVAECHFNHFWHSAMLKFFVYDVFHGVNHSHQSHLSQIHDWRELNHMHWCWPISIQSQADSDDPSPITIGFWERVLNLKSLRTPKPSPGKQIPFPGHGKIFNGLTTIQFPSPFIFYVRSGSDDWESHITAECFMRRILSFEPITIRQLTIMQTIPIIEFGNNMSLISNRFEITCCSFEISWNSIVIRRNGWRKKG